MAVWLLILALAVSCGSSSDISPLILAAKGGTSNSDDGSLTLEIPPGALAEDTEIRVSRVIEADLNREEIPELAKYILEPAGKVFSKPVRLSIELPLSLLDSGFSVLHSLAEDPDDLDQDPSVAVELDDLLLSEDGSEATLMMQISHFSTITVIKGPVKTTLSVPDIADVGVPFSARAITSTIGIDGRVESREEFPNVGGVKGQNTVRTVTITVRPESPWDLTGNFWAPIPKGNLSPKRLDNAPPKTRVTSVTFTSTGTFTCLEPGEDFNLYFEGVAKHDWELAYKYTKEILTYHDHIGKHRWETYIVVRASGECYLPPGSTPTPSPTPTPGPAFPEDPYEALEALEALGTRGTRRWDRSPT